MVYIKAIGAVVLRIAAQYPNIEISVVRRGENHMLTSRVVVNALEELIEAHTDLTDIIVTNVTPAHAIFQAGRGSECKIYKITEYSDEYAISVEGRRKWAYFMDIPKNKL